MKTLSMPDGVIAVRHEPSIIIDNDAADCMTCGHETVSGSLNADGVCCWCDGSVQPVDGPALPEPIATIGIAPCLLCRIPTRRDSLNAAGVCRTCCDRPGVPTGRCCELCGATELDDEEFGLAGNDSVADDRLLVCGKCSGGSR